jgi:hypothetical protein
LIENGEFPSAAKLVHAVPVVSSRMRSREHAPN